MSKRFFERIIILALLVVLIGGSAYSAWLFLKNTVSVELSERKNFSFKDYEIRIEEISSETCLRSKDFACIESRDVPSVLVRIVAKEQSKIDFVSLSEVQSSSSIVEGLQITLRSIDLANNNVRLDLKKL